MRNNDDVIQPEAEALDMLPEYANASQVLQSLEDQGPVAEANTVVETHREHPRTMSVASARSNYLKKYETICTYFRMKARGESNTPIYGSVPGALVRIHKHI